MAAMTELIEEALELVSARDTLYANAEAWQLRSGRSIVVRDQRGRTKELLIAAIPAPCDQTHIHVQLRDGRRWCYDRTARVEMT